MVVAPYPTGSLHPGTPPPRVLPPETRWKRKSAYALAHEQLHNHPCLLNVSTSGTNEFT